MREIEAAGIRKQVWRNRLWVKEHARKIRLFRRLCPVAADEVEVAALFDDFEAVFFDDGIGQDFFGDTLELLLGLLAGPAVQIEDEKLALADVFHFRVAQSAQGVLNRLTLRV